MTEEERMEKAQDTIFDLTEELKQKNAEIARLNRVIERLDEKNEEMLSIITKQSREIREYQNMERVKKIC